MKICCDLCTKLLLPLFVLMLSMGSLQAQSQTKCDLSKCTPEQRKNCAKKYSATASLASLLFAATTTEKTNCDPTNCDPANCNPVNCKKTSSASAKLVSTETIEAPIYSNNLDTKEEKVVDTGKKKCCASKCSKVKTSL